MLFPNHLNVGSHGKSSVYAEFCKVHGFINLSLELSSYSLILILSNLLIFVSLICFPPQMPAEEYFLRE